jgi:acyl-CoA synthetase (NDP forming)
MIYQSFEAFARKAWACGKPVVALKTGRSDQAQAATVSHTASIAGSSAGATALFDRLGIAEVQSLPVLLETLKLLHVHGPLKSARIASLSCSGGEASLMADLGLTHDVVFPDLTQTQSDALREALGPKVALANPLDYHTYIWGDSDAMTATFAAMMAGDLALGLVVLDFPREDRCDGAEWEKVIGSIESGCQPVGQADGHCQLSGRSPAGIHCGRPDQTVAWCPFQEWKRPLQPSQPRQT